MNSKQAELTAETSLTPSARVLHAKKEAILRAWIERVRAEVATASELQNPIIVNTIPLFLSGLAEALCDESTREIATESSNMAQEHGGERARVTRYGPEQIIQEYCILRDVIRQELQQTVPFTEKDNLVIQKSFDKAIQESMTAYFLVHAHIREQFIATLTHDLRNPINAMKLASELIADVAIDVPSAAIRDDLADLARRITKNARRADRMIQEMLDASLVQVGERLSISITEGDIAHVVQEAVSEQPPAFTERLKVKLASVTGYWDLDALQRSVENLISNAFKYGDECKPVTVVVRNAHGRVMVSVHNLGNPIPAENLETLFQVFRRAEAAKKSGKKGWGIGLALARTTAERMGGSLTVDSSDEKGTTFTIDIPIDARPFTEAPTSATVSPS